MSISILVVTQLLYEVGSDVFDDLVYYLIIGKAGVCLEIVLKMMCVKEQAVPVDTLKGIVNKLSIKELETLSSAYKTKTADASVTDTQLCCNKNSEHNKSNNNNQFTI